MIVINFALLSRRESQKIITRKKNLGNIASNNDNNNLNKKKKKIENERERKKPPYIIIVIIIIIVINFGFCLRVSDLWNAGGIKYTFTCVHGKNISYIFRSLCVFMCARDDERRRRRRRRRWWWWWRAGFIITNACFAY